MSFRKARTINRKNFNDDFDDEHRMELSLQLNSTRMLYLYTEAMKHREQSDTVNHTASWYWRLGKYNWTLDKRTNERTDGLPCYKRGMSFNEALTSDIPVRGDICLKL